MVVEWLPFFLIPLVVHPKAVVDSSSLVVIPSVLVVVFIFGSSLIRGGGVGASPFEAFRL